MPGNCHGPLSHLLVAAGAASEQVLLGAVCHRGLALMAWQGLCVISLLIQYGGFCHRGQGLPGLACQGPRLITALIGHEVCPAVINHTPEHGALQLLVIYGVTGAGSRGLEGCWWLCRTPTGMAITWVPCCSSGRQLLLQQPEAMPA